MARSTTSFLLCALFLLGTLAIIQVIDLSPKFLNFASFSDLNLLVLVFIFPLYVNLCAGSHILWAWSANSQDFTRTWWLIQTLLVQAKKSEDLKEVTHKVYFDVEIAGKPAGTFLPVLQTIWNKAHIVAAKCENWVWFIVNFYDGIVFDLPILRSVFAQMWEMGFDLWWVLTMILFFCLPIFRSCCDGSLWKDGPKDRR